MGFFPCYKSEFYPSYFGLVACVDLELEELNVTQSLFMVDVKNSSSLLRLEGRNLFGAIKRI